MGSYLSLEKDLIQGTSPGQGGRGEPRTPWLNNVKAWTGLTSLAVLNSLCIPKFFEFCRRIQCAGSSNESWRLLIWPTL